MAFCHQCGSDIGTEEGFCPICGIALRSAVIDDLDPEEEVSDPVASDTGAAAARPAEDPADSVPVEETDEPVSPAIEPEIPDDEFVDISALHEGDEEDESEGIPLREKAPSAEPVPEGEFVDISALRSEVGEATEADDSEIEALAEAEPGIEEPAAEEPAVEEPVAEEPVAEVPVAEEPVAEEPVAEEPVAEEPVAEEPVAEEPVAEEPVAVEPVAEEPVPIQVQEPKPEPPAPSFLADPVSEEPQNAEAAEAATPVVDDLSSAPVDEEAPPVTEAAAESQTSDVLSAPTEDEEVPQVEPPSPVLSESEIGQEVSSPPGITAEEPALADEPALETPPAEASKASEPVEDEAAEEAEAEAEEETPDFLEDATLISMPIPDLKNFQESARVESPKPIYEEPAAGAEAPPEVSDVPLPPADLQPEEQASQPPAPVTETPPASEPVVPHSEDGETTLEEEAKNEVAPAAVDPSEERSNTTPNIGGADTDGSRAPKLQPLSEGTVLNSRYEIVRKIGGGGMGAVYLASDKNLGGVLRAVKEMVQSYIEEDQQEKAVQDFKRESMLLTSLEHPSIPTIYDYFFDEDAHRFYLVMKYISGGDLAARLRSAPDGKLDESEVTEWAIQIADVLDYLHNRQPPIVYRDLKPANIMLDGNSGKVMLIDFGIARWINKEEKGVTAVGTMGYAPPELFSGNVVPTSDIYSLGSTMFHLLTGADPQNNPLLIFDFEKNPRPRQINSRLSDQIESILMRAVEYNAEKRFADAGEMRDSLTEHLARLNAGTITFGKTESPKSVGFSDQSVFCGFCGQKIVATDMFCAFCGAKQPLAQPGVQSQEYIPVKLTAKLIIEGTSQLDYPTFELAKDENLVGRRDPMSNIFPEVDLSKFDPQTKISRKHARIWRDGKNFMLEDLGSSNGTILIATSNESVRLTPHQAQVLTHGDRIKLGDTMLHFVITA